MKSVILKYDMHGKAGDTMLDAILDVWARTTHDRYLLDEIPEAALAEFRCFKNRPAGQGPECGAPDCRICGCGG